MSVAHQVVDVLLAGAIAGAATFLVSAVAPGFALVIGIVLASMYCSRVWNRWHTPGGLVPPAREYGLPNATILLAQPVGEPRG